MRGIKGTTGAEPTLICWWGFLLTKSEQPGSAFWEKTVHRHCNSMLEYLQTVSLFQSDLI